jgi:AcrR family transcriptional regulator
MKEEILHTVLQLFLKHGIWEMSNQKLVEQLGISTKTLYKYFKNKEELLEDALDLFHAQQRDAWKTRSNNKNTVALFFDIWNTALELEYNINKAFFQDLHYYYPELERKKEVALSKEYTQPFIQIIYKGIDEGVFLSDINPEIIFGGIAVLYQGIVRRDEFKDYKASANEILMNTITPYIRGFCTQKGIEELNGYIKPMKKLRTLKASRKKIASKLV